MSTFLGTEPILYPCTGVVGHTDTAIDCKVLYVQLCLSCVKHTVPLQELTVIDPCNRDMVAKYGIKYFYDITDRADFRANPDYKGVCHIAMAQEGHCLPGQSPISLSPHKPDSYSPVRLHTAAVRLHVLSM